jgi:hypothetical protein
LEWWLHSERSFFFDLSVKELKSKHGFPDTQLLSVGVIKIQGMYFRNWSLGEYNNINVIHFSYIYSIVIRLASPKLSGLTTQHVFQTTNPCTKKHKFRGWCNVFEEFEDWIFWIIYIYIYTYIYIYIYIYLFIYNSKYSVFKILKPGANPTIAGDNVSPLKASPLLQQLLS